MARSVTATEQGRSFEERVAHLFALLNFSVHRDELIAGRQVDLVVEDRSGPLTRSYIVECKNQAAPVTVSQVDAFRGRLAAARHEVGPRVRGVIVASVGFVKEAKAQSRHDDVELVTISELEFSLVDFRPYVRRLVTQLEDDSSLAWFVEPSVRKERDLTSESAFLFFDSWLRDTSSNHLTLLGDFGTGKTTLLKHLALRVARRYETEVIGGGARGRVPILVDLRDYTHAVSLKLIIQDLLDSHGIQIPSYAAFEHLSREGQVLIILDGFDEMASRGNHIATLRNFQELNRSAMARAKIVLSCRTHYFTSDLDVRTFVEGEHPDPLLPRAYTDLYREIATKPNFALYHLEEFTRGQVEEYLGRRCGPTSSSVSGFIKGTYNLEELSRRPVLLDLIVSSAQHLDGREEPVTPGLLYRVYTDIWLSRNDWRSSLTVATKRRLLQLFAARAATESDYQLHFREIPAIVAQWDPSVSDAQAVDAELRTASFLVRDGSGMYRFSHKSFQQFFFATHLLTEASAGRTDAWSAGFFKTEVYRFVRDILPTGPDELRSLLGWLRDERVPALIRTNVAKCVAGLQAPEVQETLLNVARETADGNLLPYVITALGYHPGPDVEQTLMRAAKVHRELPFVFANALASLARFGSHAALAFVKEALARESLGRLVGFFRASRSYRDPGLVRAMLQRGADPCSRRSQRHIMPPCLDLCRRFPSDEADRYCAHVLETTHSNRLAARAFGALSSVARPAHLGGVFARLQDVSVRRRRNASDLVAALGGIRDERVWDLLCEIADQDGAKYPLVAAVAFGVLAETFPDRIKETARRWMNRSHEQPYFIRIQRAHEYFKHMGTEAIAVVRSMLAPEERASVKRAVLDLIMESAPESLAGIVGEMWDREPATLTKRHALKLLRRIDRPSALRIMLERGLRDSRAGTRIAVCEMLGAELGRLATDRLLDRLASDDDAWVRQHALRSLVVPGRGIARDEILAAMRGESDPAVLRLRHDLLGF